MKLRKKQLVLASLVLALGAAVYLTWQFQSPVVPTAAKDSENSELGAAQLVNNSYIETVNDDLKEPENAEDTAGTVDASATISEIRMSRQSSRDEAVEMLETVLSNVDADTEAKEQAVSDASAIAQNILKETNLETLLTAKGYKESVAYITGEECRVVVSGELSESDMLIIQDAAIEQTGLAAENIKINGIN